MPENKKLDVLAMALALGLLGGGGMLLLGILGSAGWGSKLVQTIGSLYVGYEPTLVGSLIGGLWGFADGLVGGAIFAWIYNRLAR